MARSKTTSGGLVATGAVLARWQPAAVTTSSAATASGRMAAEKKGTAHLREGGRIMKLTGQFHFYPVARRESSPDRVEFAAHDGAGLGAERGRVGYAEETQVPEPEPAMSDPHPDDAFPLPGYEIVRELGRGGDSVVYLARC